MRFSTSFALLALLAALLAPVAGAKDVAIVSKPTLFAPEADWPAGSDASPAFTPDGQTVFFTHAVGAARTIMVSHLRAGVWSKPATASFSGTWRDIEPPWLDGSYRSSIRIDRRLAAPLPDSSEVPPGPEPGSIWRVNQENWGRRCACRRS